MNTNSSTIIKVIVTGVLFLSPLAAYAQEATSTATSTDATSTVTSAATTTTAVPQVIRTNADVESKIRAAFSEAPIMIDIARCESKFRQYDQSGSALHGGMDGSMVGAFQIYDIIHRTFALSRGMDIDSLEGNIAYAHYLYDRSGTDPWISSFPCWNSAATTTVSATSQSPDGKELLLTTNLSFGMIHPEVIVLQKILNSNNFIVSPDGPGSIGNETNKFGTFTRIAIRKFQCAQNIACSGDEYSTGYGYVGPRTRAALTSATPIPEATDQNTEAQIAALRVQIAELIKRIAELRRVSL